MATVTSRGITFATASGTETVVATPALGDLIVIVVAYTGNVVVTAPTDNNADGHGTYELVTSALKNTSADLLSIWVRSDPIRSATSTTFTIAPGVTTGGGLQVFSISGLTLTGPSAIRQSGAQANGAAAATPACPFGVVALTGNPLIGAVFNGTSPATMTAPTGFTESQDVGYSTPTTGLETALANSGVTASTITWASTSASAFSAVALELDTRAGQTSIFPPRGAEALDISFADTPKMQGVKRSSFFMLGDKWRRRGTIWVPRRDILTV